MTRHIVFPAIEQFRSVVKDVTLRATCTGTDAASDPIYDDARQKPVLDFEGTVKLHGINTGISWSPGQGLWYQTRETIITPQADLKGFAKFAEANRAAFESLFAQLQAGQGGAFGDDVVLTIFGEWCGQGIQQGVAISALPKSFFIFAAKITRGEEETWLDSSRLMSEEHRLFNVESYAKYRVSIDFNCPESALAELASITERVEAECPIAKAFGISGVGEGVVWKGTYAGETLRFKVKGEKHSVVKAKTITAVDAERHGSLQEFVAYAVTQNRVHQAIATICGPGEPADVRRLGDIIRWMQADIAKEESDTLAASGLQIRDVSGPIAAKTREIVLALRG